MREQPTETKKEKTLTAQSSQLSFDSDEPPNLKLNNYEEFKEFALLPHEYILLVSNSFDRQSTMNHVFQPNFNLRKKEIINNI